MHYEFSLAHLTVLALAPPDMVWAAARCGYGYVGLRLHAVTDDEPVYPLAHDSQLLRRTKEALVATGVGVLDVELVRLTPDFDVCMYEPLLEVSAELGARHVIAQAADADLSRAIEHFARLCEAADRHGLTVDIEFVTWTETPDLERAAKIVRGADRDNAGVLIDTLHFSRSNCRIEDLKRLPPSWFHYAQVCDAPEQSPGTVEGLIFAARSERLLLGDGGLDLREILGALPRSLPYSLEIPNAALAAEVGLEECARRSLVSAKAFFDGAARVEGPSPSTQRGHVRS